MAEQSEASKPRIIRNRPRASSVCESPKGEMLRARHPWVEGVMICIGIGKLMPDDRNRYRDGLALLLSRNQRPKDLKDCPASVPEEVKEAYFRPFYLSIEELHEWANTPAEIAKTTAAMEKAGQPLTVSLLDHHYHRLLKDEIRKNELLEEETKRLQARIDSLQNTLRMQSEEGKDRTLGYYYRIFKRSFTVGKNARNKKKATQDVLRRVTAVLNCIGMDKRLGTITATTLQDAIKESCKATDKRKTRSEREESNRGHDIRRFFKWLGRKVESGGIGLRYDPSEGLEVLSRQALQARRRLRGEVVG